MPVLVLKLRDNEFLINTTERFLQIGNSANESVYYTDFKRHRGYRSIAVDSKFGVKHIGVKTDGYFADFGLEKQNGEVVYWSIPTGKPGFAFWNLTKKFNIIGRKYIIKEYGGI